MPPKQNPAVAARDLRHRILSSLTKLSDKDTHSHAVSDLLSLIPTLTPDTFSLFINSLSSTSASDRSSVRCASLSLLSSLSLHHRLSLSLHLPKLTSAVLRRLRDPDSAVRSAATSAVSSFARNSLSTASSFVTLIRTLSDALATEQEVAAQGAAAMCIAAAIDDADVSVVDSAAVVRMLPKWIKLLRSDGFKAKSGVLILIRSVIRVCKIGNCNLLKELVNFVGEFLKVDDWMARKAGAELLMEIAVVEREFLSEFKIPSLKLFESRKFDKVKGVREAMIQMVEAWKEVPDVFDDGSPPPRSQTSSKENGSDGRFPARSRISSVVGSNTPQTSRKQVPSRRSSLSDSALRTTARNRCGPDVTGRRSITPVQQKRASKKPSGKNIDDTALHGSSVTCVYDDNEGPDDDGVLRKTNVRPLKPETKRSLFSKNSSSRVTPYTEDCSEATLVVENSSADNCRHQKDSEDLSLIRKQLVQIETQQSSLMDILQKFIGASQDGMRTLETRVHGLERALDDISYDLAVSTARMSNVEPPRSSCCMLPGSDFLSSKFWRRPVNHLSTSRFSFSAGTPSVSAIHSMATNKNPGDRLGLENRRFHLRGPGGVIMNPLAEIHGHPRGVSEASSSRVFRGVHTAA